MIRAQLLPAGAKVSRREARATDGLRCRLLCVGWGGMFSFQTLLWATRPAGGNSAGLGPGVQREPATPA